MKMRIFPLVAASCLALGAMPAWAAETKSESCAEAQASPKMSVSEFAGAVAMVDMAEIKLGEIAKANAGWPAVKGFGAYMVRSHKKINDALEKVAAAQGIKLPGGLDAKHEAMVEKLVGLKGEAFDAAYIPAMVEGHTKVLAMFQSFAASTTDPAFKAFAEKYEKKIAKHLERAQFVENAMKEHGMLK